ncbi:MAG: glycosyltransferase family 2 protein [Candidatus Omnitrophica bacterium]|jgi:glycosyltransferase involved in cell wall biosynthesis|nr:glycosyltransferase family 2 protein [Candidatus Omnitrophota bacterium]
MPKNKNYTIAVTIPSKNSEKKIANCLASIKDWADEIIVLDSESIDKTVEIAKSFGAKVFVHPFLGSWAKERNFGAEQANSNWILSLDTDEVVSEDFKKKCDDVLPNTKCAAFKFWRKNFFLGHPFRYGGWYHKSQHLYNKKFAHYEGMLHEKYIVNGEVGDLDAEVLHYPFDSISEFIERQNRYTSIQAIEIIAEEKDLDIKKIKYNLTWKPLKLFKKMYFNKKGYKEGMHGLVFSILFSWVHFVKWAKVWEIYNNSDQKSK